MCNGRDAVAPKVTQELQLRASERRRDRCNGQLGGGDWRRISAARAPHGENLDALCRTKYPVVDVMLRMDQENTTDASEFDIFCDCACFWILGYECKSSSQFFTEEVWSLRAVATPPMRLFANLLSGERGGLDQKCHCVSSTRPVPPRDRSHRRVRHGRLARSTREACVSLRPKRGTARVQRSLEL